MQAVIRSLPTSWERMKVNLTHNENVVTFNDVAKHLELEDECQEAYKTFGQVYMVESTSPLNGKPKNRKGNKFQKKGKKPGPDHRKGKKPFKKEKGKVGTKMPSLSKVKCYSCQKMGHFGQDYTQHNDSNK